METTTVVLLLCSLVALGSACCTPDQWEGLAVIYEGYASRRSQGIVQEYIQVSYDAINNRTSAFVDIESEKYSRLLKIITRYDNNSTEGKVYYYDIHKDKCWTQPLKIPFNKLCVPLDAAPLGNYSIGLDGGLNVTAYQVVRQNLFTAIVSVEEVGNGQCVPVNGILYGKQKRVDYIQNLVFLNITSGIRNESVFDIPEQCNKSEDADIPEQFTWRHFIMGI